MVRHGRRAGLLPQALRPWLGAGRRRQLRPDPITAQGISDAFIDAEMLADALDAGLSGRGVLSERSPHTRGANERVEPLYDFTYELATLEPPPPHMQDLFAALHATRRRPTPFTRPSPARCRSVIHEGGEFGRIVSAAKAC